MLKNFLSKRPYFVNLQNNEVGHSFALDVDKLFIALASKQLEVTKATR